MRFLAYATLLGAALASPTSLEERSATRIYPGDSLERRSLVNRARADAVKQMYRIGWDGYYKHAFPMDQLQPVTNTGYNPRNGWGATAVDGLDTAIIMGLTDIVNVILDYIPTIDYTKSYQNQSVSLFETTIRYLGGMMAAYDLLNGPYQNLARGKKAQVKALLSQSIELGNVLEYAFNTTTGIPYNDLYINNGTYDDDIGGPANLAQAGTLVLEWQRLSDLSGDEHYGRLAQKAESYLLKPRPASSEPFPGLVGSNINITSGLFTDAAGGWQGGDDSFYEYLLKFWIYNSALYGSYKDRWVTAADSTIKYLTSHPKPRPDITFLNEFDGTTVISQSEELACFDGGSFILGGLTLKNPKYTKFGLDLAHGCRVTYDSTVTKIGPEQFAWNDTEVPADQREFYKQHGYYITSGVYVLRPEYLESLYYAYRATGNEIYRQWSWEAITAINATTRAGSGYSDIENVNVAGGGGFLNDQESFLFAEALKYAYLIQAEDSEIQVNHNGKEAWVFNTEAHVFKVAGPVLW